MCQWQVAADKQPLITLGLSRPSSKGIGHPITLSCILHAKTLCLMSRHGLVCLLHRDHLSQEHYYEHYFAGLGTWSLSIPAKASHLSS